MTTDRILRVLAFVLIAGVASVASAHEDTHGNHAATKTPAIEVTAFGRTGDPKRVTRTINVDMDDRFRFTPAKLNVKKGETVRIVARNKGKLLHEIVIGSPEELTAHAEMMRKSPDMEHETAYMAHVPPGKSEEIIWQFTTVGDFKFGCLVAGHFEAGMVGDISVR